jgi:hypothetical protein
VLTLIGVFLRLNAHSMAWPTQYSYSGPTSDTTWAIQENAIGQIALALMFAGILIFVVTYFYWLFDKQSDK